MKLSIVFLLFFSTSCQSYDTYHTTFKRNTVLTKGCFPEEKTFTADVFVTKKYTYIDDLILYTIRYDLRPDGKTVEAEAELQEVKYCAMLTAKQEEKEINGVYIIGKEGTLHPFISTCPDYYTFSGTK